MKRYLMIVIALGLAAGGCKKEEKKDEGKASASGSGSATGSGTGEASGSGSASASGTGMASALGSGTASGVGSGTDVGTGSGTGSGTGTTGKRMLADGSFSDEPDVSPEGGDVTLRWVTPAAGSKYDQSKSERVDAKFGGTPVVLDRTELVHVEVLESGDYVNKVKVHYEKHQEVQTAQGQSKTEAGPVEGKTYLVWSDGGKITATLEDGAAISPAELEEISESFDDEIGTRPGIADMLLHHAWKTGVAVKIEGADMFAIDRDLKKGSTLLAATCTLKSVDGKSAVFEMSMTVGVIGDVTGETMVTLSFVIDTDPLRPSVLETTVDMNLSAKGTPMTGQGKSSEKYTYR